MPPIRASTGSSTSSIVHRSSGRSSARWPASASPTSSACSASPSGRRRRRARPDGGRARGRSVPLTPVAGHAHARRYLSLALWAAVLLAPSTLIAAGLLAGGAVGVLGPAVWRAARRHRRRGRAVAPGAHVVLGADAEGHAVTLADRQLAAHSLIVGASGAGKSTTMLAVLDAQIRRGQPVIAVDMKGSPVFADRLRRAAEAAGRGLRVWMPDGPGHWNPLAHGNATSLKDKLISTERFSEPHYQRAAERYVQMAIGVLHAAAPDRPAQLHEVVAVMEP